MCVIEKFVILIYDQTSTSTRPERNYLQRYLLQKFHQHVHSALETHVKQIAFQNSHVSAQTLAPDSLLQISSQSVDLEGRCTCMANVNVNDIELPLRKHLRPAMS